MSWARLNRLIEQYGTDWRDYPWFERCWVRGYLLCSLQAKVRWQNTAHQDQLLRQWMRPPEVLSPALQGRLQRIPERWPTTSSALEVHWRWALMGIVPGVMVGMVMGGLQAEAGYEWANLPYEVVSLIWHPSEAWL